MGSPIPAKKVAGLTTLVEGRSGAQRGRGKNTLPQQPLAPHSLLVPAGTEDTPQGIQGSTRARIDPLGLQGVNSTNIIRVLEHKYQ
jgi:hypothetical protein